jgi:hypothetical protein
MLAFDMEKEVWRFFAPLRNIVSGPQLYESDGRLLLVGYIKSKFAGEETSLVVWEFGVWAMERTDLRVPSSNKDCILL